MTRTKVDRKSAAIRIPNTIDEVPKRNISAFAVLTADVVDFNTKACIQKPNTTERIMTPK
jgi:hypothetical protein